MKAPRNRSRDYAGTLGLSFAVLGGELPPAVAGGEPDPWMKVTPSGPVKTRDGRNFTFDPATLVDRFKSDGVDLPADFDHGIALNAMKGVKSPAVGWATDLEARPDGTYAKMDWLPDAKTAMADRTHRYVSPTFHHDDDGNATWLHSISLTAAPALTMPAIASVLVQGTEAGGALATLAAAVGLPQSADLGAVLAAAARALADMVPRSAHDSAIALAGSTQTSLATLAAEVRARDVGTMLDDALRATKILPFQRDQYLALCSTDAGLATVKTILATALPYIRASGLDGHKPPGSDGPATAQAIIDAATVYQADKAKLGLTVSMADAITAVGHRSAA